MKAILILVEGQTEESFINQVLQAAFEPKGLALVPVIVKTRMPAGKSAHKGGTISWDEVKKQLLRLLNSSNVVMVTTMFDFYGLPKDYPGYSTLPKESGLKKALHLEEAMRKDLSHPKFEPYLALHEFEALLFVSPMQIIQRFPRLAKDNNVLPRLNQIRQKYNPEEINETLEGAPSKRLEKLIPNYGKKTDGPIILKEIGLMAIRQECPHFAAWLEKLESLAIQNGS